MGKREDRLIEDTLRWANVVRRALGHKPLKNLKKGKLGDSQNCPLYQTLNGGVSAFTGDTVEFDSNKQAEKVRKALLNTEGYGRVNAGECSENELYFGRNSIPAKFVRAFDNRRIPQFDIDLGQAKDYPEELQGVSYWEMEG